MNLKYHTPPNQPITDWQSTQISVKMEAIGKFIARECYKESMTLGGNEYKFNVQDICNELGQNMGSVEITWKL